MLVEHEIQDLHAHSDAPEQRAQPSPPPQSPCEGFRLRRLLLRITGKLLGGGADTGHPQLSAQWCWVNPFSRAWKGDVDEAIFRGMVGRGVDRKGKSRKGKRVSKMQVG